MSKTPRGSGRQLTFAERPRRDGRKRAPMGRRPGSRPSVRHRPRPEHRHWNPLHVTLRAVSGLASFRQQMILKAFEKAFRTTRREDFRIVEYSVQVNHLHLVVEAENNDALARGMKSFSVRANRLFNSVTGRRRGRVWADRYHRTELTSPRQVRHALVYCINNFKKHQGMARGRMVIDACSSARWFTGWSVPREHDDGPRPTEVATTFLLRVGWRRHGLIDPGEVPGVRTAGR